MQKPFFSISDVLSEGFSKLKKNFLPLFLWHFIFAFIVFLFFIATALYYNNFSTGLVFSAIVHLKIFFIISAIVILTLWDFFFSQMSIKISKSDKCSFYDLKPSFKNFPKSLVTIICFWGLLIITFILSKLFEMKISTSNYENPEAILSFIGLIFFIIRLALYNKLFLANYISIEKNHSVEKAFKESIQLTPFWKLIGFNILQNLIIIVSLFIFAFIAKSIIKNPFTLMIVLSFFILCFLKPLTLINNGSIYKKLYRIDYE